MNKLCKLLLFFKILVSVMLYVQCILDQTTQRQVVMNNNIITLMTLN